MADSDIDSFSENESLDSENDEEEEECVSDSEGEEAKEGAVQDEDLDQQAEVPKDIKLKSSIVAVNCHPKKDLIVAGTIDGPVHLYSYSTSEGNQDLITYEHHKKHCRAVKFSPSGDYLFTGSQDTLIHIIDMESNSEYRRFCRPDGSAIYSLLPIDNFLLASGEEDGQVVIWDFRVKSAVACFEDCEDYVSSLAVSRDKKTLLATSGEGVLAAFNIKAKKVEMVSEAFDNDFLSLGIIKHGTKVVVGTGDGSLNIFNFGEYGGISDRFPGHPGSVECLEVISDDVVCTGCEDGKVRAVQLFPTRFLGVLGQHNGFTVESLSVTHDSKFLASSSHDQSIKFWDLTSIEDEKNEELKNTKKKHFQLNKPVTGFFADLE